MVTQISTLIKLHFIYIWYTNLVLVVYLQWTFHSPKHSKTTSKEEADLLLGQDVWTAIMASPTTTVSNLSSLVAWQGEGEEMSPCEWQECVCEHMQLQLQKQQVCILLTQMELFTQGQSPAACASRVARVLAQQLCSLVPKRRWPGSGCPPGVEDPCPTKSVCFCVISWLSSGARGTMLGRLTWVSAHFIPGMLVKEGSREGRHCKDLSSRWTVCWCNILKIGSLGRCSEVWIERHD